MKRKIILSLLFGVLLFGLTGCDNSNNEPEETLDKIAGTWYLYDKDGVRKSSNYLKIDGKGNFYYIVGDYAFYKDGGNYVINGDKIKFYTDSTKSSTWRDCTLQTSNKMLCISGSTAEYFQK